MDWVIFGLSLPAWEGLLIVAGYTAIVASGLYFSNSAGVLSVASAAVAGIGGYLAAVLTTNFGWPFAAALVAATASGGLIGAILAVGTLRMTPLVAGLATLAFGEAMTVVAYNTAYIGGAETFTGIPPLTQLWQVGVALALILVVGWRFQKSTLGLAAQAVRDNPTTAAAMGIDVPRVKIVVFALGSAIAGLGGAFRAHYVLVISPDDLGFWNSVNYIIFWIFGGGYSFIGPTVGTLVLTILPELLRFSGQIRFVIYGAALVAFVILRPEGLITRRRLGSPSFVARLIQKMRPSAPAKATGGSKSC